MVLVSHDGGDASTKSCLFRCVIWPFDDIRRVMFLSPIGVVGMGKFPHLLSVWLFWRSPAAL
ncbi:unnamed protein product [Camellia sinensis]